MRTLKRFVVAYRAQFRPLAPVQLTPGYWLDRWSLRRATRGSGL